MAMFVIKPIHIQIIWLVMDLLIDHPDVTLTNNKLVSSVVICQRYSSGYFSVCLLVKV